MNNLFLLQGEHHYLIKTFVWASLNSVCSYDAVLQHLRLHSELEPLHACFFFPFTDDKLLRTEAIYYFLHVFSVLGQCSDRKKDLGYG
jgi:hypothetical protein